MAVGLFYHDRDLVVSLNRTFISSEEQHDDQLLHELLRCLKALSTSEIGCFALRSSCPTPFVQLVSLLYSDKRPGDVPTRQLIVDLLMILFDLYPPEAGSRSLRSPCGKVIHRGDWRKFCNHVWWKHSSLSTSRALPHSPVLRRNHQR